MKKLWSTKIKIYTAVDFLRLVRDGAIFLARNIDESGSRNFVSDGEQNIRDHNQ